MRDGRLQKIRCSKIARMHDSGDFPMRSEPKCLLCTKNREKVWVFEPKYEKCTIILRISRNNRAFQRILPIFLYFIWKSVHICIFCSARWERVHICTFCSALWKSVHICIFCSVRTVLSIIRSRRQSLLFDYIGNRRKDDAERVGSCVRMP